MDLLPCNRPEGLLEQAPRTSLRADSTHEVLEGFWCLADERYYAHAKRRDGTEQWYCIGDEGATGVLPFRRTSYARRTVMMVGRAGRRSMLVGVARRGGVR